ncbi:Heme-responsive zinc finger transcription factor HAP1 [Mycena venus]|uniref:Heme-responsive zinc finger transcription factor HAP1 n=1 Tax=Mycena venus TaxID=2733690 RepID=A0A8H6YT98_9AGAR|nr:Heme-responsive zinc finger transcription factor HAP1 [Mycena venus]
MQSRYPQEAGVDFLGTGTRHGPSLLIPCTPTLVSPPPDTDIHQHTFAPLQLKGEIMDLEFTIDTDHRKRRRNRTTQSCLNCHTSKRKCDRKRPCQRCIQLGLTGLCVYEIDDPALRDDPSVDENTRLRNRIAELESLANPTRAGPTPTSATATRTKNGTRAPPNAPPSPPPNSSAGTRPSRRIPSPRTSTSPLTARARPRSSRPSRPRCPPESTSPHLYRFSNSPGPGSAHRYFPDRSGSFDNGTGYDSAYGPLSGSDDGNGYGGHYSPSSAGGSGSGGARSGVGANGGANGSGYCPCRASPGMGHAYISLSQALQSTLTAARTYAAHPPGTPCVLFRRIADLASLMQYVSSSLNFFFLAADRPRNRGTDPTDPAGPAYSVHSDSSTTPTDSEVLTPPLRVLLALEPGQRTRQPHVLLLRQLQFQLLHRDRDLELDLLVQHVPLWSGRVPGVERVPRLAGVPPRAYPRRRWRGGQPVAVEWVPS